MSNLAKMDSVQFQISCGIDAITAIHTAMDEGPFEPAEFVNALLFALNHLKEDSDMMRELIDQAFAEARKEAAV